MDEQKEKIKAFVDDILTKCANKGFTVEEVGQVCGCLQDKYRRTKTKQINGLKFDYLASIDFKTDCDSGDE